MIACFNSSHFVHGLVASAVSGILVLIIHFGRNPHYWSRDQWDHAVEAVKEALLVGLIEGIIVSYIFCTGGGH